MYLILKHNSKHCLLLVNKAKIIKLLSFFRVGHVFYFVKASNTGLPLQLCGCCSLINQTSVAAVS